MGVIRMRLLWIAMIGVLLLLSCIAVSPKKEFRDAIAKIPAAIGRLQKFLPSPEPCGMHLEGSAGKDLCFLNLSISANNTAFCYKIRNSDDMDWCYYAIAAKSRNIAACEKILSVEMKQYCRKDGTMNISEAKGCDLVPPNERSLCYQKEALSSNNSYACSLIPSKENQDGCIIAVAEKTLDPNLCKSADPTPAEKCILYIALKSKKPDYCELLDGKSRDECLSKMAINFHDKAICNGMLDGELRENCNYIFVPTYLLPTVCALFNEPSVRDLCYSDFARINRTISVCENVTASNQLGKEGCIRDAAISIANGSYCLGLNLSGMRDSCFSALSMLNRSSP